MNKDIIRFQDEKMDFGVIESINMLRTNIHMAGVKYKAIAITSSSPNEGKSFIAFQLSKSMASLGKQTVLVDCDIRNTTLKKKYGIKQKTIGLSEYLGGTYSADDIIMKTDTDYLSIVFSGGKAPNPSELLSTERFKELLIHLREQYDYIILDTPPVNVVTDATVISVVADTSVLVVKSMYTDRIDAIKMQKQLENNGANILGVVINLCDAKQSRYGKYGYGKYGYGKYGYGKYGYGKYGYGNENETEKEKSLIKKWIGEIR